MDPARAIRASKKQAVAALAICALGAAYELHERFAPGAILAAVVLALVWRHQWRVVRSARSALASGQVQAFAEEQRRSHRARGRVYVWTAPFIVAMGWAAFFVSHDRSQLGVSVQIAATAFLAFFWFWWRRTLRAIG